MPGPALVVNGQVNLLTSRQGMAAQGKMFNVTNPTPGTAVAYALQTGFSATANGLFAIANGNPIGGAIISLDRLKLIQTATAPATTTQMRFEAFTEFGAIALSGTAAARTPVNINPSFANATTGASVTSFAAGAGTVAAAGATRRLIDIGAIQTGVTVLNDQYIVDFGTDGPTVPDAGLTAARATAPTTRSNTMAAVTIPPGYSAILNMWWITQTTNTPSFEFSLTYVEL